MLFPSFQCYPSFLILKQQVDHCNGTIVMTTLIAYLLLMLSYLIPYNQTSQKGGGGNVRFHVWRARFWCSNSQEIGFGAPMPRRCPLTFLFPIRCVKMILHLALSSAFTLLLNKHLKHLLLNSGWLILLTTHRDIIIHFVVCISQHPSPEYCPRILQYTAFR